MSDGSLFSPAWHRVSGLRPRLRSHISLHRHIYRGERWYILRDLSSGRHHRFASDAYALIAQMDGVRTLHEIWAGSQSQLGEQAPSQSETIRLLTQLHSSDLLQSGVLPNTAEQVQRGQRQRRQQRRSKTLNPLALRLPLTDPDRFLSRTVAWVKPLFTPTAFVLWLLTIVAGLVLAAVNWTDIVHHFRGHALSVHTLTALVLIYPLMKALHEFAHAYATKHWGGEVHEMGVSLLVFVPVPYVDAGAAAAFPKRRRRILVSAIGMMVEAWLAAVALIVWLEVEPGLMSTAAFAAMIIGGFSTLLFNGNPLLKFDGYYVLSDLLQIPNLSSRSTRYLIYLAKRHVFGMEAAESAVTGPGERPWLIAYGMASFIYRLVITCVIALYVAGKFLILGVLIALWGMLLQIVLPLARSIRTVVTEPQFEGYRVRIGTGLGLALSAVIAFLMVVPLPLTSHTEGVVWLPDDARIRAGSSGFVSEIPVSDGQRVKTGEIILKLENHVLATRRTIASARLLELQARYQAQSAQDRVQARILKEEIEAEKADLTDIETRQRSLEVRSTMDGHVILPNQQNLLGRHVDQGELVAYVAAARTPTARVVVNQDQVGLVRRRSEAVRIRLSSHLDETYDARIVQEVPGADRTLPSAALGVGGGGTIAVDPEDETGRTTLEDVFHFELSLPEGLALRRFGQRVYVRFNHGWEPIGYRWARAVRRLFLSRFAV